jgi:hypothetical protein
MSWLRQLGVVRRSWGEHDGRREHLAQAPAGNAAGDEEEREDGGDFAAVEGQARAQAAQQRLMSST